MTRSFHLLFCLIPQLLISHLPSTLGEEPCRFTFDKYDRADMMSRNVLSSKDKHWPNGTVPYIYGNKFTDAETQMIDYAMSHIQNHSGVQFIPRCDQPNYVNITNDDFGCYVLGSGFDSRREAQKLNLQQGGCFLRSIVVHELLHALGYLHEHTRPDRDEHVTIVWGKIRPSIRNYFQFSRTKAPNEVVQLCNFTTLKPYDDCYNGRTVLTYGLPYDFISVMHYSATSFSVDGNATIVAKNYDGPMGGRGGDGLSELDKKKLNTTYPSEPKRPKLNTDCSTTTTTTTITTTTTTTTITTTNQCVSTYGNKCIFPFTYKHSQFEKCTKIDNNGLAWCATEVENTNKNVIIYGICKETCEVMPTVDSSVCQTTSGFKCKFPFNYIGVEFTSCTDVDFYGVKWCSTQTDQNGNYNGHYGICGKGC